MCREESLVNPAAALLTALHSVQPAEQHPERAVVARPAVLAVDRCPARPSVAAAPKARRQVESTVPAQQLAGLQPEEPAGWAEAAAELQWEEVAPQALAARPKAVPGVLAVLDAAAGPQRAGAPVAVGVQQPEAAAVRVAAVEVQPQGAALAGVAAVQRPGAVQVAGVRRRVARGAQAVLPSAPASAAALSTQHRGDRPAPSPQARSAHAQESLRIAQP
jgi:hypothetical protein